MECALKTTTGSPAEGEEKFFPRSLITKKIWRKLNNGEHLLITAPRRVGKTTILKDMVNNPQDGYIVKYIIVQSVDKENEFYKLLFNELVEDERVFSRAERYSKQASATVKNYIQKIKSFGLNDISIDHTLSLDYANELKKLIYSIDNDCKRIVIIIDEYPHAVENILKDDLAAGIHFLQANREYRQDSRISSKVNFIYTGSIGLGNIVKKIDQSNLVTDLAPVPIPPLTKDEATELIQCLIRGFEKFDSSKIELKDEIIDYLIRKIDWLIPYYIQIIIDELFEMHEEGIVLEQAAADQALQRIIKNRYKYDNYFEHWKSRLKAAFDKNEQYKLALDLLNQLSADAVVDTYNFHDLAVKHAVVDSQYVRGVLEYDGYINEHETVFRFNSPILKAWWFVNVAS